jgi:hypothetical protein
MDVRWPPIRSTDGNFHAGAELLPGSRLNIVPPMGSPFHRERPRRGMVPCTRTSGEEWAVEWDAQGIASPLRSHPVRITVSPADQRPLMGEPCDRPPVNVTTPALVIAAVLPLFWLFHRPWQGRK